MPTTCFGSESLSMRKEFRNSALVEVLLILAAAIAISAAIALAVGLP
jgi:hypothetical protein